MSEERIAMLKAQINDVHKEITRLLDKKREREMMLFAFVNITGRISK